MRKMGGLRTKIHWTFGSFLIGTLAIAGIPGLAGYYSKDEILLNAVVRERMPLFFIGAFTALLTAFYMSRLLFMTFFGPFRGGHDAEHHVHESPWSMLVPLVTLAAGCFVVGRLHIEDFLRAPTRAPETLQEILHPAWFTPTVIAVAVAGIIGAFWLYVVYTDVPGRIAASLRPLHRALEAKWGFDIAYDAFAKRVVVDGSDVVLWKQVDVGVIDAVVNGSGRLTAALSAAARAFQTGLVRAYALVILGGAVALIGYLLTR